MSLHSIWKRKRKAYTDAHVIDLDNDGWLSDPYDLMNAFAGIERTTAPSLFSSTGTSTSIGTLTAEAINEAVKTLLGK